MSTTATGRDYVTEIYEGSREPPELQTLHKLPLAEPASSKNPGGQMPSGRTDEQYAERQRGPQPATAEQRAAQGRDPDGYWECRAQESDPGRGDKQLEAGG